MRNKLYTFSIVLCVFLMIISLTGCHTPQANQQPAATATTAAEAPSTESNDSDMLLINPAAVPDETGSDETESTEPEEEEGPLISNPGRSSLYNGSLGTNASLIHTASLTTGGSNLVRNAQIVRPTTTTGSSSNDGIVIQNDHQVTYPQNQSVIQKSVPSGTLQPLSYIPPQQMYSGQSIMFATGATSAVISGYVPAGGSVSYNLYAFANQNFLVLLSSDSGTSVLGVNDVYGNVFLDPNQRQTSYNMYLPRTATYYVNIYSTGYSENFTLQVFIPARVTIPTGQTSTVLTGSVAPYSVVSYTAYMYAGQVARIDDYSGSQPTSFLRVSGLQTGVVYMDYTQYSPSWYSVVPATQDYLIEVISMDQTSNYRLTVDVRQN